MTIRDLLRAFEGKTKIDVQLETVNPFNKSDVIYNSLYFGEIRGVDKISLTNYMEARIVETKLCIDEKGNPFISALMEGSVL